jgi:hypothetical protein
MKKLLIIMCVLVLPLGACAGTVPTVPTQSPAPLAQTTIDDTALETAWKSFDVALDAIDLWKRLKPDIKGTPKAIKIADAVDKVTQFLTAAESAAATGSATNYKVALANAKSAITELRLALQE